MYVSEWKGFIKHSIAWIGGREYHEWFPKTANIIHSFDFKPTKIRSFWHEFWVFLNLVEMLVDRLEISEIFHITPCYDFWSCTSFIEQDPECEHLF